MAQQPIPSPITDPQAFGVRVFETARHLARGRFERGNDAGADDIAMLVFLQFWSEPQRWMTTYSPEVFAAVALSNRAEDWRRAERIQRGEGAHLTVRDGLRKARRDIGSLEAITEQLGDHVTGDHVTGEHDVADAAIARIDVRNALGLLSWLRRVLVWKVDVEGYSVVDVAKALGLSRSYCQRELGTARQFIRDYVVAA